MTQAHNNLNVLTHPLYYMMRYKIKNNQRVSDNMSLLCAASSSPETSEVSVDKNIVLNSLPKSVLSKADHNLKNGDMKLYDTQSFSNNRTYILDTDEPFSREDFLEALRNSTRDPIKYINSSRYIEKRLGASDMADRICPEDDTSETENRLSFLHILDPTNLVRECISNGLISSPVRYKASPLQSRQNEFW